MSYRLVVFDWDGTLYDSSQLIITSVQQAAVEHELTPLSSETIRQNIGLSVDDAFKAGFPMLSPMQRANLIKTYRAVVAKRGDFPSLFSGVREVLTVLQAAGIWMAIATSKHRAGLEKDLLTLDLTSYFMTSRTPDECPSKPAPDMVLTIMEELGVSPAETVVVGDTEFDMLMAQNAGVEGIAVSYGAHDEKRLRLDNVKTVIHHISELPYFVK